MKIFKFLTAIFAFTCIASACKKSYLDVEPIDRYTTFNFIKTESEVNEASVGLYRSLVPIYTNSIWTFGEMLSDNSSIRFNPSANDANINSYGLDHFLGNSNESTLADTYRDSYNGISRSNFLLQSIPDVVFTTDSIKNMRIGEGKFFRAFHYFNLVRLYGDVPLVTKVFQNPSEQNPIDYPRVAVQRIYEEVILPDAIDAVAKLPQTVPANQRGRLTKPAAQMLLGKVYLTLKRFPEALTNFDAVTGYTLNTNYAANFTPATKNGVESIFELQVLPVAANAGGYSLAFMGRWAPWGTGSTFWGGGSNAQGGLNQPTRNLRWSYEFADSNRRKASIRLVPFTVNGVVDSVACFSKFSYFNAATNANDAQWPIYRFAETLLSRAECLNEAGFPNAQAFTLLNQVRSRAGLLPKTQGNSNPLLAINSQADFRLAIEHERRVEFAGEGHRWFDLVRTDRATAVMTAHGVEEKSIKTHVPPTAYNNIKLLVGIPFREIEQFGYSQNPGW
jgi:starch-binding outer membrane protein, SusD/RagB family